VSEVDKDILDGFREESKTLVAELEETVESLEGARSEFPAQQLEEFAQKIDRIMGAAKTLLTMAPEHPGLKAIATLSEISKRIGYQAAKKKQQNVIPLFAAFWADMIESIDELLDLLDDPKKSDSYVKTSVKVLQSRLEWLSEKVGTPGGTTSTEDATQDPEIAALLASLD